MAASAPPSASVRHMGGGDELMPTYEYECEKCGQRFERFQNMSDSPVQRCPECRGKVRRLIGGGGAIIFKGSGFYETDYKKNRARPVCGSNRTCCGRNTQCDSPPCKE